MKRFASSVWLPLVLLTAAPAVGIELSYPNGGETLTQGTGCVITWDTAGIVGPVALEFNDGTGWQGIAAATANDGAHSWALPHATSGQYQVRITDTGAEPPVSDASDAAFSVVASTIRVLFPNDGGTDYLLAGRAGQIRWNSFGDVEAVKIEYSYDNGVRWQTLVASTPNDGRHPWTPAPPDSTSLALVRITDVDGSPGDTSDAPFSVIVVSGTVTFTVDVPPLPPGEFVSVSRGERVERMTQIGPSRWRLTLGGFGWNETFTYRYCRNGEFGAAREVLSEGYQSAPGDFWREATATADATTLPVDTVGAWRWWPAPEGFTLDTSAHENTPPAERPAFMRGVMLPDWWSSQNPWSPLVGPTLDWMVRDARAGWVQLVGVAEITSHVPPTFSRAGAISIPDEELVKLVGEAHARGLKVFFNPGEVSFLPDAPPRPAGEAWWRAYASQWRSVLLRWASLAQANGVEMLGFRMWPNLGDIDVADRDIVDLLAGELLAEVRAAYSGPIAVDWGPGDTLGVFGQADYLNQFLWDGNLSTSFDPTVADLRTAIGATLDGMEAAAAGVGKPVILGQYAARAFDGAAGAAFVLDPGIGESDFSAFQPGDPALTLDLQEQADVLEAMLHEIAGRSWIAGAFSFGAFYWSSVDKDLNVRGKPAETVLAKWHRWLDAGRVTVSVRAGTGGTTTPAPGEYSAAVGAPFSVTAVPATGYVFAGWTGCGGETGPTCNLTLSGDTEVGAAFTPLVYSISTTVLSGSGAIACDDAAPASGATVTCTLTPGAGFYLSALTDNGAGVLASATGTWVKTYAIASVAGDHSLQASFAASAPLVKETFSSLAKWTGVRGAWTLAGGAATSGSAADALLVHGSPSPNLKLLRSGTLLVEVKIAGTATTANGALLFSYLGPTRYRYVRLRPGKVQIGQVGAFTGSPQPPGTVRATATYGVKLNTWYQLRLDLGALGEVGISIRQRGAAAWTKLALSGGFKKFPSAATGGVGLGVLRAVSAFDNFSTWDPGRPPK